MSESNRKIDMSEEPGENNPASQVDSTNDESTENQEYSWYGGKVDEAIVREIVRLKREHKP